MVVPWFCSLLLDLICIHSSRGWFVWVQRSKIIQINGNSHRNNFSFFNNNPYLSDILQHEWKSQLSFVLIRSFCQVLTGLYAACGTHLRRICLQPIQNWSNHPVRILCVFYSNFCSDCDNFSTILSNSNVVYNIWIFYNNHHCRHSHVFQRKLQWLLYYVSSSH